VSAAEILVVAPLIALVAGGIVVLLLEAVGTPVGARKTGRRTHLAVITVGAAAAAATQLFSTVEEAGSPEPAFGGLFVYDRLALTGQLVICGLLALGVVSAVPRLRELRAERGEIYAILLALGLAHGLVVATDDILVLGASLLVASIASAALSSLDRAAPRGAEAAVKEVKAAGFSLALLGFAAALTYLVTGDTTWTALATVPAPLGLIAATCALVVVLGRAMATPLNMPYLDVAQGAPPFAGALVTALNLSSAAVVLVRAGPLLANVDPALGTVLSAVAILTLLLPGVLALDQRQVPRVFAHLLACGAAPVLAAALTGQGHDDDIIFAAIVSAAAGASALAALGLFERGGAEGLTWERYSGVGRARPYYSLALLWMLASLVGFPGTAGFSARLFIATAAFEGGRTLLGVAVLGAIAIGTAPVLRFGILLFARTPEHPPRVDDSPWRTAVFALGGALLFAAAVSARAAHELLGALLAG
jgi:NADH-quinone oxidoreductase subunit N